MLKAAGFNRREREAVRNTFQGNLNEPEASQRGIDKYELERSIQWMHDNPKSHRVSPGKLDLLKQIMQKKI